MGQAIIDDLLELCDLYGRFDAGAFDPPWKYGSGKTGGSFKSASDQHYDTMTLAEIAGLPMKKILAPNAVVFLWIPGPLKDDILTAGILKSWGLQYRVSMYWVKTDDPLKKGGRMTLGAWFRGPGVEEILVCVRYKAKAFYSQESNIIYEKPRKHSQKPEGFFKRVEPELTKTGLMNRLELFARGDRRPGWIAYGNEVTNEQK